MTKERMTVAEYQKLAPKSGGTQPETVIKKQVRQFLETLGWFVFYNLQGVGAYKGIPDFICVRDGRVVFLEVKTAKGKLSDHQGRFKSLIEMHGGEYRVTRGIDDLRELMER